MDMDMIGYGYVYYLYRYPWYVVCTNWPKTFGIESALKYLYSICTIVLVSYAHCFNVCNVLYK